MIKTRRIKVRKDATPNLIRELGLYVWDDKASLRGDEKPLKVNDHAMDAMRYLCRTIMPDWRIANL